MASARGRSRNGRHRHGTSSASAHTRSMPVGQCPDCRKKRYVSRSAAKTDFKRLFPDRRDLHAYACTGGYWHFGTQAQAVRSGDLSKAEVYGGAA